VSADQRTRWGYHQLRPDQARRLVRDAGVGPGDLVVDLGAGTGGITGPLMATGARVIAVELHPRRAAVLERRFAATGCRVVVGDIVDWQPPDRPFRVVANPPFAVLATTLRLLTAPRSRLVRADLVVPDYVAARWARGAGPTSGSSRAFTARRSRIVAPHAFEPPAPGLAAVLTLYRMARRPPREGHPAQRRARR
jgi:23S rRNA (adenine-N6)-dimethyltransferase